MNKKWAAEEFHTILSNTTYGAEPCKVAHRTQA